MGRTGNGAPSDPYIADMVSNTSDTLSPCGYTMGPRSRYTVPCENCNGGSLTMSSGRGLEIADPVIIPGPGCKPQPIAYTEIVDIR